MVGSVGMCLSMNRNCFGYQSAADDFIVFRLSVLPVVRKKSIRTEFRPNSQRDQRSPETDRRASLAFDTVTSCRMPESGSHLDLRTFVRVAGDILQFAVSLVQPRAQLAAENLFLRK